MTPFDLDKTIRMFFLSLFDVQLLLQLLMPLYVYVGKAQTI